MRRVVGSTVGGNARAQFPRWNFASHSVLTSFTPATPCCRRNELVLRSRRVSSDEQDCYPDDQTETEPHILAKATEKPKHGREPGCHNHQPTVKHQNDSRAVRHELGPSQRFLAKYDESDSGHRFNSHAERKESDEEKPAAAQAIDPVQQARLGTAPPIRPRVG